MSSLRGNHAEQTGFDHESVQTKAETPWKQPKGRTADLVRRPAFASWPVRKKAP
jgi:hypothetical protein